MYIYISMHTYIHTYTHAYIHIYTKSLTGAEGRRWADGSATKNPCADNAQVNGSNAKPMAPACSESSEVWPASRCGMKRR